eukprot:2361841-Rhodomonas_salina.2
MHCEIKCNSPDWSRQPGAPSSCEIKFEIAHSQYSLYRAGLGACRCVSKTREDQSKCIEGLGSRV